MSTDLSHPWVSISISMQHRINQKKLEPWILIGTCHTFILIFQFWESILGSAHEFWVVPSLRQHMSLSMQHRVNQKQLEPWILNILTDWLKFWVQSVICLFDTETCLSIVLHMVSIIYSFTAKIYGLFKKLWSCAYMCFFALGLGGGAG